MVGPRVEGEPEAIEPEPRHFEFINRSETRNEPEPRRRPSVYDSLKFERLLEQWRTERDATRSVAQMVLCSSYQKIIGMGEAAIPFIIAQLKAEGDEPDHWFWALRVITEVDPVADEDRGQIAKMAQSWLDWAESTGYAG